MQFRSLHSLARRALAAGAVAALALTLFNAVQPSLRTHKIGPGTVRDVSLTLVPATANNGAAEREAVDSGAVGSGAVDSGRGTAGAGSAGLWIAEPAPVPGRLRSPSGGPSPDPGRCRPPRRWLSPGPGRCGLPRLERLGPEPGW